MKLVGEKRTGLFSEFYLKCQMCNCLKTITSDKKSENKVNINSSIVLGSISTGIGYSQTSELAATLDLPFMTLKTYNNYHEQVAEFIRASAWQTMELAAAEEIKMAKDAGNVDENGIPCITVVTDGAWSKRSYNVNYDAMSGVACIIGYNTGKLLFLGVRNKYCSICSWHESKEQETPTHRCFKNWTGSSTAMETDIIAEGFRNSLNQYGIKYSKMVGDGDSSVYRKLLEIRPYGNCLVQKIECKNHILRNFAKKIREISSKKRSNSQNKPVPITLRKCVLSRFMRLRSAITKATTYRIGENTSLEEKVQLLRNDINNAPSHVFGEHNLCKTIKYFKCEGQDTNIIPVMKECGIYEDVMSALQRVIDNASSLIMNMDNNLAEHYNSVVCKFIGGKRINFSLRGSYQTRCEAAALSFNSGGEYHRMINKTMFGNSPKGFYKKFYLKKKKEHAKIKARRTLFPKKKRNRLNKTCQIRITAPMPTICP
ncbi:uncharacterized protein LOC126888289 [Diabrotica virgifera virgifera]|uniref:Mutator-like transposase domain-containing protein n=2 Tax=Diabrotica virgifera virgifera TaxID=50390 RepID=A0ABM5KQA9_DIAVI|nr:uncharacterized protein LOC126888289 [Diabrotica virgifera virgifera]